MLKRGSLCLSIIWMQHASGVGAISLLQPLAAPAVLLLPRSYMPTTCLGISDGQELLPYSAMHAHSYLHYLSYPVITATIILLPFDDDGYGTGRNMRGEEQINDVHVHYLPYYFYFSIRAGRTPSSSE
jgi:hypothetical protein